MNPTQIAAEAAREVANKCALHLPYIKEREIGKATAIIQSAIEKATDKMEIIKFYENIINQYKAKLTTETPATGEVKLLDAVKLWHMIVTPDGRYQIDDAVKEINGMIMAGRSATPTTESEQMNPTQLAAEAAWNEIMCKPRDTKTCIAILAHHFQTAIEKAYELGHRIGTAHGFKAGLKVGITEKHPELRAAQASEEEQQGK